MYIRTYHMCMGGSVLHISACLVMGHVCVVHLVMGHVWVVLGEEGVMKLEPRV